MYSLAMETYRPRLRRTALHLVHNESDADDIVQEAFARWYASPPRDRSCPEAWLVTVVRRLCVDAHRSKKKEFPCDADALGRALTATTIELERAVVQEGEIAIALRNLSERASTEECVALILREGFAYPYPELARVLCKSEEACRQLVHRGKCAAQGLRTARRRTPMLSNELLGEFLNALHHGNIHAAVSISAELTASSRAG